MSVYTKYFILSSGSSLDLNFEISLASCFFGSCFFSILVVVYWKKKTATVQRLITVLMSVNTDTNISFASLLVLFYIQSIPSIYFAY